MHRSYALNVTALAGPKSSSQDYALEPGFARPIGDARAVGGRRQYPGAKEKTAVRDFDPGLPLACGRFDQVLVAALAQAPVVRPRWAERSCQVRYCQAVALGVLSKAW